MKRALPCGRRRMKLLCGKRQPQRLFDSLQWPRGGSVRIGAVSRRRKAAEDYDTHEGLATHTRLGPEQG